jgi:hypothetical protein
VQTGLPNSVALAKALADMKVSHVAVENVHAMPKQGVSLSRHLPRVTRAFDQDDAAELL